MRRPILKHLHTMQSCPKAILTLLVVATSLSLPIQAKEPSTTQPVEIKIGQLKSQLENSLKALEEVQATLQEDLDRRKKIKDPDSNFQLGTLEVEAKLAKNKNEIAKTAHKLSTLKTSESALEVCSASGADSVKKAIELRGAIQTKLKALNADSVETNLKRAFEETAALKARKNSYAGALGDSEKKLNELMNSSILQSFNKTFFEHLEGTKQIAFSPKTTEEEKRKLLLGVILNPSLLDEIDQSTKNAGRATDNLIGSYGFNPEFLKAVAPNGTFPRVLPTRVDRRIISKPSPAALEFLNAKTGFAGIEGIKLDKLAVDHYEETKDRIINQQSKAPSGVKNVTTNKTEIALQAQERLLLETMLEESLNEIKVVLGEIKLLKKMAADQEIAQKLLIDEAHKKTAALQSAASEVRSLKRFEQELSKQEGICSGAESFALETIDQVLNGSLSSDEGVAALYSRSVQGANAIREIDRIQKQPGVHGLLPPDSRKK